MMEKSERLLRGILWIDEELVVEAEDIRQVKYYWDRAKGILGVVAACLFVTVIGLLLGQMNNTKGQGNISSGESANGMSATDKNVTEQNGELGEDTENQGINGIKEFAKTENAVKDGADDCIRMNLVQGITRTKFKGDVYYADVITANENVQQETWEKAEKSMQSSLGLALKPRDMNIGEEWKFAKYYSIHEEDRDNGEEDKTHDFIFLYEGSGRKEKLMLSLCGYEEPLRDYVILCDHPEKSAMQGIELMIYVDELQENYICQFCTRGIYGDLEYAGEALEENEFLTILREILKSIDNCQQSETQDGDLQGKGKIHKFEDVPVDEKSYHEATEYPEDIQQVYDKIVSLMMDKKLPFVASAGIYENPVRVELHLNSEGKETDVWEILTQEGLAENDELVKIIYDAERTKGMLE